MIIGRAHVYAAPTYKLFVSSNKLLVSSEEGVKGVFEESTEPLKTRNGNLF
jgi:hypothetical protein